MKSLISILGVTVALAFTGPAFAGDVTAAKTETDCQKAGGVWNAQGNECAAESAKMGKEEGTHQGAHLGASPENDSEKIDQPDRKEPGH
jgi:hypothetical protein